MGGIDVKGKIKESLDGFLLALQFYTTIPIKRELPLDEKRLKKALYAIPFIGIGIGLLLALVLTLNEQFFQLPATVIALLIITIPLLITGGLHLDGWMDASDAFFSYRDKEKRLQIMDDPRTGSFAVLSLIFLLAWRYLFIFETLKLGPSMTTCILIVSLYYFARFSLCYVFIRGKLAKQEGLAAFFKKGLEPKDLIFCLAGILVFLLILVSVDVTIAYYAVILFLVALGFAALSKAFIEKQFGGISGDTLGATLEGGETVLWLILWLLHLFATGLQ